MYTKLLTKEILKKLPPLYATENTPTKEKIIQVKFFYPDSSYSFYGIEFDGENEFFGIVDNGLETELGYFSLNELKRTRGALGCSIERDRYFYPCKASEILK